MSQISFVCTQLNGFRYYYVIPIIQSNCNNLTPVICLHTVKWLYIYICVCEFLLLCRKSYLHRNTAFDNTFNKGRSSKFCVGSRVRQTPEEGRRTYRPKRCGNNNKDEDNSSKTLNDKIIKLRIRNLDNKHLKKAGGHIGRNAVEITIKMKTIVRKALMVKIIKLHLRNLDNKHLKKAGGHIGRNAVEIIIKMMTIVRKPLMIKIIKLRQINLDDQEKIYLKKSIF